MNFILTSKCKSNCSFCFVPRGLRIKQKEMSFVEFKGYMDHINKICRKSKPSIGILGGEPTLAKDFPMIAGYSKAYGGIVRLYSNLITDPDNLKYFFNAKNVVLVWNIFAYITADAKDKKLILRNLKILKKQGKNKIIASVTLCFDFKIGDFDAIIKILKKHKITDIRIALDSTDYEKCVSRGGEIFLLCKKLIKNKFQVVSSYCGHFTPGMFDKKQEEYLKKHIANFNFNNCAKNFPVDILPGGSVVPCMGFAGRISKINIKNFRSLNMLKSAIIRDFKFDKIVNKNKRCIAGI